MGVVLSGGDADGADGLRLIKECGGKAFVQKPEASDDPSMPMTAIARDHPDKLSDGSGHIGVDDVTQLLEILVEKGSAESVARRFAARLPPRCGSPARWRQSRDHSRAARIVGRA
ncbi:MAG: chemotaxis protein CheB [Methylocystis sp.]